MENFISRISQAVKKFKDLKSKLSNKENRNGIYLSLNNITQVEEILYNVFDSKVEPDRHLINYYLYTIKNKAEKVSLYFADYLVYRSAIASLSKYFNPSLEMLMTQHFTSARELFMDKLNDMYLDTPYDSKTIIDAAKSIRGNTVQKLSYIGADNAVVLCKKLINEAVDNFIEKLVMKRYIDIDESLDLFSITLIQLMIDKKCYTVDNM